MKHKNRLLKLLLIAAYTAGFIGIVASGGGSGSGGDDGDTIDQLTLNMSPYSIISSSDDVGFIDYPLYPVARAPDWPDGESLLIRLFDPYGQGDFYSLQISNSYGGGADPASPLADDGEPDNMPMEAFTLPFDTYLHRGLNPLFDEDWFIFTSSGECCLTLSTKPNTSGSAADPVVEIYDGIMNPGHKTFNEGFSAGVDWQIIGVYDPISNLTLISVAIVDITEPTSVGFSFLVNGPDRPGNYSVNIAFPPLPSDTALGSVIGTVNIDRYDSARISGTYDIIIFDGASSTTASGTFDVTRERDEPGLLRPPESTSERNGLPETLNRYKDVSKYLNTKF